MPATDVTWSDLLQQPKETVGKLSEARRLLVHRRDADDLVLTTAARADQDHELVDTATRLFVAIMRDPVVRSQSLMDVLPGAFPWVRYLPEDEQLVFVQELADALVAIEQLDTPAPVLQVLAEWRHTAEVHADPELTAALSSDIEDHGPAPAPKA